MEKTKFLKRLWPFFLFVLVSLIISVNLGAQKKKEEILEAKVTIRVSWNERDTHSGIIETGSFTIQTNGTIQTLPERSKHESVRNFVPSGMTANYKYENKGNFKNPGDCPKLAFEASGSGSVQVAGVMGNAAPAGGSDTTYFNTQIMTGEGAKVGWHAKKEDYPVSPEAAARIVSAGGKDFCSFNFAPVTMKFHGKRRQGCTEYVDFEGKASCALNALVSWAADGASGSRH